MSILRPACYKKFADIIEAIYQRFEQGTGAPKQDITDKAELEAFLTQTITTALGEKASTNLTASTDLFSYGVDSLQATRVRNVISKSLELGDVSLGQNIVYEHPSISQLAAYLLAIKSGDSAERSAEQGHSTMLAMVDKWADKVVKPEAVAISSSAQTNGHGGQVVVLTGATGSLGAHILDQLINDPSVSKVVCLSRAKSHDDSLKRIHQSLAERERSISAEASAKIQSFASDVNQPTLGLSNEHYETLRQSVTSVIHNAWPVNFVLSIESFDEHIGGAVNLLNLTLKSDKKIKPAFFFSSSVGTRQGRVEKLVTEDFSDSPVTAGGMGYGRSKWVVEKLCERAGANNGARIGVLRIGQLVGDTEQ